jgi:hypothetical protein
MENLNEQIRNAVITQITEKCKSLSQDDANKMFGEAIEFALKVKDGINRDALDEIIARGYEELPKEFREVNKDLVSVIKRALQL